MIWTFEIYRILTAQSIAQALLEAERSRLIARASTRHAHREAVPAHRPPRFANAVAREWRRLVHAVRRRVGWSTLDAHG